MTMIDFWLGGSSVFTLGLVWKASDLHTKLKNLLSNDLKTNKRINTHEKELNHISEALNRTFAPKDYVYEHFVTNYNHKSSVNVIEEKLLSEVKHMNDNLQRIYSLIEKKET